MHENESKEKTKLNNKLDSITLGSASKTGAIKVYFNLPDMTDDEAKSLVNKAVGLYKYLQQIGI